MSFFPESLRYSNTVNNIFHLKLILLYLLRYKYNTLFSPGNSDWKKIAGMYRSPLRTFIIKNIQCLVYWMKIVKKSNTR